MEYATIPAIDPSQVPEIAQILDGAIPCPKRNPGIYFLLKDSEIVYIGQSVDCEIRIATHIKEGEKDFTHYFIFKCNPQLLNIYEALCLHKFQPKHNIHLPIQPFVTVPSAYIRQNGICMRGKNMSKISKVLAAKRYWAVKELDQLFNF